jgi:hypothetical protein
VLDACATLWGDGGAAAGEGEGGSGGGGGGGGGGEGGGGSGEGEGEGGGTASGGDLSQSQDVASSEAALATGRAARVAAARASLLPSFDGCGVWRNPFLKDPKKLTFKTDGNWYHLDQNWGLSPGLQNVQGLLNFYPAPGSAGSTVLLPRSHLDFKVGE